MKKFLLSLVMIICATTFIFAGCSKKGLPENPANDAAVIGNGGYAIQKGDYLYFVNGYIQNYEEELDDYREDNVEGEVCYSAIYRTKLSNGKLVKDEKGFLTNADCVVSKVVGYEQGGFFIFGNYIYYATPYMREDGNGVIQNTRISFNRIELDGTDNKEMYVTEEGSTDIDWRVVSYNDKVYLIVVQTITVEDEEQGKEPTQKTTVTTIADNGKKFEKKVVADSVSNYAFTDDTVVSNEYFFYTRAVKDDEDNYTTAGNLICKVSFVTGEETPYEIDKVSTFTIVDYANGRLYVTKATTGSKKFLYSFNANENLFNQNPIKLSNAEYTSYYTIPGVPHSVVAIKDSSLVRLTAANGSVTTESVATSVTNVVTVKEGFVYYYDAAVVYRIDLLTGEKQTVSGVGEAEGKTFLIDSVKMLDIEDKYVFVFAKYEAEDGTVNYFLNRVNTLQSEMVAEFVGYMDSTTMVAEPESTDDNSNPKWVY